MRVPPHRHAFRPFLTALATLTLSGLALSACASSVTGQTPAPTVKPAAETTAPVETPAPVETATPGDAVVSVVDVAAETDVLFTISTTMTSPEGTADFVAVFRSPRIMTRDELAALEGGECGGVPRWYVNPMVQEVSITSTLVSGTWRPDDWIWAFAGGTTLFSGDTHGGSAACASRFMNVPGTASVLHIVGGDDPDDFAADGWAARSYGFAFAWDGADPPVPGDPVVTACALELTPAAKRASDLVAHWPDATQPDPHYACMFGQDQA